MSNQSQIVVVFPRIGRTTVCSEESSKGSLSAPSDGYGGSMDTNYESCKYESTNAETPSCAKVNQVRKKSSCLNQKNTYQI